MAIIRLVDGTTFEARPGSSILDAALAAGVTLDHSCRTGRCGSCRAPVSSGDTQPLFAEQGLSEAERSFGLILTCAREALGDVRLDVEDLAALARLRRKTLPCRIQALARLAPDVIGVTLRLPPNADFDYVSGQHIDLIVAGGARRSYSLARSAAQFKASALLELHIRHVPGGALSSYWFDRARPNDLLRLEGPLGSFHLRDVAGLDLVFLATGTGIAPIKAMLADLPLLPAPAQPRSVQVMWGGRTAGDLYAAIASSGVDYTPVLSRADSTWRGARGHVQDVLLRSTRDWARSAVYACGSAAMVQGARAQLLDAGLPARRFHADAFVACTTAVAHN
jgi:CDP-4-dehydro-6-deoxyglucose reductase